MFLHFSAAVIYSGFVRLGLVFGWTFAFREADIGCGPPQVTHVVGGLRSRRYIDPRVTGYFCDRRINTALRPRVACSRDTNGKLHELDAS